MSKRVSRFRFKQFDMDHFNSSMRIGVDAVLIGAWSARLLSTCSVERVLDVGCGCGVIALMMAQRFSDCRVDAVDIHHDSIVEAEGNFRRSPWSGRLNALEMNFENMHDTGKRYSVIVSNPPFFDSGVDSLDSPRLVARHQGGLSPFSLLEKGRALLDDRGVISMVVPVEFMGRLEELAISLGLFASRICVVKGLPHLAPKRALLEFSRTLTPEPEREELTLESFPGEATPAYRELCAPFYLKF